MGFKARGDSPGRAGHKLLPSTMPIRGYGAAWWEGSICMDAMGEREPVIVVVVAIVVVEGLVFGTFVLVIVVVVVVDGLPFPAPLALWLL